MHKFYITLAVIVLITQLLSIDIDHLTDLSLNWRPYSGVILCGLALLKMKADA